MWTSPDAVMRVCVSVWLCMCYFTVQPRCQFVQIDIPRLARVQFPQFSSGAAVAVSSRCRCLVRVVGTLVTL